MSNTISPFFPPALQRFFERAAQIFAATLLLGLGLGLAIAMLTYSPADPSLNTAAAADQSIENALGLPGAYMADITMQGVGLAGVFLVFSFMGWGARLMVFQPIRLMVWRLLILPLMMAFIAAFLAALPVPESWPLDSSLGGLFGSLSLKSMVAMVFVESEYLRYGLATLSLFLGLGLFLFVGGTTKKEMMVMAALTYIASRWTVRQVYAFARSVVLTIWTSSVFAFQWLRAKILRKDTLVRLERKKPRRKPAKAKQKPANDASRKPKAPKQAALNFGSSGHFNLPSTSLLQQAPPVQGNTLSKEELEENARQLETVLNDFGVQGEILNVRPGPVVTLYELEPAPGIKSARVIGLADDIARSMSAISARVAVVPGKNVIGIELPNASRETVFLRELLETKDYGKNGAGLPLVLGKDIGGQPIITDLSRMPHLLIAGTTGSGKSVAINTMILSLLYRLSPDELRMIMIDPKMLELSVYDDIPHLLTPVVTDPKKSVVALKWCVREMENRYRAMSKVGVRNIAGYNQKVAEAEKKGETLSRRVQTGYDEETGNPLYEEESLEMKPFPYIVVVVDEMADLMLVAGKDIEAAIQRLAQMARAAGIHIIMATQRPSVDVITGTIKANFPTRISFQVTSKIDSRTILGEQGAEQLLGQGDMLYMAGGGRITRVHGPFVEDGEVEDIVTFLRKQGAPDYLESVTEDDDEGGDDIMGGPLEQSDVENSLYDQAVALVVKDQKASISYIQRRLRIGYNKAATLMERMEEEGVVSAPNGGGKRDILVPNRDELYG